MIYVILGMHKSGTTLVSQILHHSGINMGADIDVHVPYDKGNKYERVPTWRLNEDILNANGVRSIDITVPDTLQLTVDQQRCLRHIIQCCNKKYANWGFKDPRTCLLYPLWASELPEHKIIAVYRAPYEAWPRYRATHLRNRYRDPYLAWKYLKAWCEHNLRVLTYLQNTETDYILLEYRRLMTTQTEVERLQEFMGIQLSDQRRPQLYRNQPTTYPVLDIISWLLCKRKGYCLDTIMQRLEGLRE